VRDALLGERFERVEDGVAARDFSELTIVSAP